MKLIDTKMEVRRYRNPHEWGSIQKLERATYVFGKCVYRKVLDEEEVPSWAEIQKGSLGYTDWVSKFSDYIR